MYLERPNWINFARSPIERLISQFYFDKNSKLKPNNILQAKEKEVSRKFKSTKPLEKRTVVLKKRKSRQPRQVEKNSFKKSIDSVSYILLITQMTQQKKILGMNFRLPTFRKCAHVGWS